MIETKGRSAIKFRVESLGRANEKKAIKSVGQIQAFSLAEFAPVFLGMMINCSRNHGSIGDITVTPHSLVRLVTYHYDECMSQRT